jgi:sugar phosphate isomerase/epimerase
MNRPNLSLGSWAFAFGPFSKEPWSFSQVLEFIAGAGYDGVEINGFRPHPHPDDFDTPEKCRVLVRQIEDWGLGISGYAPDFSRVPPAVVDETIYMRTFEKCLSFCVNCGITALRVDTVSPPELLSSDEFNVRFSRLTQTWHQSAEVAQKAGVRLLWEFEPGFWLNKPSEVRRVVESVDQENFKLLFDTSHAYMSAVIGARHTGDKELLKGGVSEYARLLAADIGHLHLIDSDGTLHNNETSTHIAFGQGNIDFIDVLTELKPVIGQLPWWCVDFCFNPQTPVSGKEAVPFVHHLMDKVMA